MCSVSLPLSSIDFALQTHTVTTAQRRHLATASSFPAHTHNPSAAAGCKGAQGNGKAIVRRACIVVTKNPLGFGQVPTEPTVVPKVPTLGNLSRFFFGNIEWSP
jgi:hypothetical protein